MIRRVAVRGIIVNDEGKIFAVRQRPYPGALQLDGEWWCVAGGGLDPGEPMVAGLQRELLEELGVKPEVGDLLYIQQFVHKDTEQFELFFHIKNHADFLKVDLSKTSHGDEEIEEFGFINPTSKVLLPEFLAKEDLLGHISSKGQPKIFNYIEILN